MFLNCRLYQILNMSDLSDLIKFYEQEKTALKSLIRMRVKYGEYDLAHYHHQALMAACDRLNKLRNIKDPNYERKNRLEKLESSHHTESVKSFVRKWIDKELPERSTFYEDGQFFEELLYELLNNRIKGFRMSFSYQERDIMSFSFTKDHLQIKIWYEDDRYSHQPEKNFLLRHSGKLIKLGFTKQEESFLLRRPVDHIDRAIYEIKPLLAALFYEIFDFVVRENRFKILIEN